MFIQEAIEKQKKEKEAAMDAAMGALQKTINDLNEQIEQHEKNITALDNAIERLRNGEDPEVVASDPDIKKLIAAHEKRTGKKVDVHSPTFLETLIAIKEYESEQREITVHDLNKLDPTKNNVETIKKIKEDQGLDNEEIVKAAANSEDFSIKRDGYIAAGYKNPDANKSISDFESEQIDSTDNMFGGSSVAASISSDDISSKNIQHEFAAVSSHKNEETPSAPSTNFPETSVSVPVAAI